jgi:hypothetical protein
MRDAILRDEPGLITIDEPAPAPSAHHFQVPDLCLPEWRWVWAPLCIVYGLAFFAPITFSTQEGMGFALFLGGLLCTVAYPFQGWKESAASCVVVCWLANPLFWIGLSLIRSRQHSRRLLGSVFGVCAVLAALAWFLPWNNCAVVGPAYLLWCGSFVLLAGAGLLDGIAATPHDPREQWRRAMDDERMVPP